MFRTKANNCQDTAQISEGFHRQPHILLRQKNDPRVNSDHFSSPEDVLMAGNNLPNSANMPSSV